MPSASRSALAIADGKPHHIIAKPHHFIAAMLMAMVYRTSSAPVMSKAESRACMAGQRSPSGGISGRPKGSLGGTCTDDN